MANNAGRASGGFICTSANGEELYKDKLNPAVKEGAAADRNVDEIDKMIEIKITYDTDPDLAPENTRLWVLSLTAEQKNSIHHPIEMEKAADAVAIEQVAKRRIVSSGARRGGREGRRVGHLRAQPPGVPRARARPAALLELFEKGLASGLCKLA